MSAYRSSQATGPPALVLGYARLRQSAISVAVKRIADLLS
jgi:hypothetical protein